MKKERTKNGLDRFLGIISLALKYTYAFKNLMETVLLWAFHVKLSSIDTPKNLVSVSRSRVIPSMNSSGNFVRMKHFLEVG